MFKRRTARRFPFVIALLAGMGLACSETPRVGESPRPQRAGEQKAKERKPAPPLKVHFISGSREYRSEESLTAFQKYLEARYRAVCTWSRGQDKGTLLLNLQALDTCDVLLIFCRRLRLSPAQTERIKAYCLAGKPIVGIRTASHAFQTFLELDQEVLGGNYKGHYGNERVQVTIEPRVAGHPVLNGVKAFTSRRLYKAGKLADDVTVLMRGENSKGVHPVTWVRAYKGARVCYTSLGVPEDFTDENCRRLLVNALYWTARRKPDAKPAQTPTQN